MNRRFWDMILSWSADAALEAFLLSMGIPSLGGSHEPKRTDVMKLYKNEHSTFLDKFFADKNKR